MSRLTVLNGTGDTEIKWDPGNPTEVATMRATVDALKAKGFVFFLVDGHPANEPIDGLGTLSVRRISPEEVATQAQAAEPTGKRRRGSAKAAAATPGTEVVAHRRMQGG
jgi:hypothetical protein